MTRPLSAERPDLVDAFRGIPLQPELTAQDLGMHSTHAATWACRCGATFTAKVADLAKCMFAMCDRCRPRGRSLLEIEVARLLRAATGLEVLVDFAVPVEGNGAAPLVDLCIPALGWLIDLDSALWHQGDEERDSRKSARLAGRSYHRIRQAGLAAVPGCIHYVASRPAWDWALALRDELVQTGVPFRALPASAVDLVTADAAQEWVRQVGLPPSSGALAVAPWLIEEFVRNLTRPAFGLEWANVHSRDRALWRCRTCRHEWEARIGHRVAAGSGCPRCANGRKGRGRPRKG